MKRAGFLLWWIPGSFFFAVLAWGLMWITDRLYDWGVWWLGAPIRIIVFIMQIGVILGCLVAMVGTVWFSLGVFYRASRGRDTHDETNDDSGRLNVKRYMTLLALPVAMVAVSLIVVLFHNWLNFNEQGLGIISWGYGTTAQVLQIGSCVVLGVWLIVLPIFLSRRRVRGVLE